MSVIVALRLKDGILFGYDTRFYMYGFEPDKYEHKVRPDKTGTAAIGLTGVFIDDDYQRRIQQFSEDIQRYYSDGKTKPLKHYIDSACYVIRERYVADRDTFMDGSPAVQKFLVGYFEHDSPHLVYNELEGDGDSQRASYYALYGGDRFADTFPAAWHIIRSSYRPGLSERDALALLNKVIGMTKRKDPDLKGLGFAFLSTTGIQYLCLKR